MLWLRTFWKKTFSAIFEPFYSIEIKDFWCSKYIYILKDILKNNHTNLFWCENELFQQYEEAFEFWILFVVLNITADSVIGL